MMTNDQAEIVSDLLAAVEEWLIGIGRAVEGREAQRASRREALVAAIDEAMSAMETEGRR